MVNVNDIEFKQDYPDDILGEIFIKQKELAVKYFKIEGIGISLDKECIRNNLDSREGQKLIKDFMFRTIEELGEAFECLDNSRNEKNLVHYLEEITDALHFFVELLIICGYERKNFRPIRDYLVFSKIILLSRTINKRHQWNREIISQLHWDVVYCITLAGNCLKNKSWKKTQVLTDRRVFDVYILGAFISLLCLFKVQGLGEKEIYEFYFKKNKVNQFRQRSNY